MGHSNLEFLKSVQTSVKKIIMFLLDKFLLYLFFREDFWICYGGAVMVPFCGKEVLTALWSWWFLPCVHTENDALFFINPLQAKLFLWIPVVGPNKIFRKSVGFQRATSRWQELRKNQQWELDFRAGTTEDNLSVSRWIDNGLFCWLKKMCFLWRKFWIF